MELFRASPRQADLMIVAGRVSPEDGAGPAPASTTRCPSRSGSSRWACAPPPAGMFTNYAIVQGVDTIVPVDIYVPGCPPQARDADVRHPEAPGEGAHDGDVQVTPGASSPSACGDARRRRRSRATRSRSSSSATTLARRARAPRATTRPRVRLPRRASTATDWPGQRAALLGRRTSSTRWSTDHRLRVKVGLPARRPARPVGHGAVPDRELARARGRGTSSASSSTGIPDLRADPAARRLGGTPAPQGRGARRRRHAVPRRVHPAGRPDGRP